MAIYHYLRPLLFRLEPEVAQAVSLKCLQWISYLGRIKQRIAHFPQQPTVVWGLSFPNPVGLAAGLDKNGDYLDSLLGLGFGFIEVGAVTPRPQLGNPRPRIFRVPVAGALINRMGFNNLGVDHLVQQLKKRRIKGIVGVNIGKNLTTPLDKAHEDYCHCLEKVYPWVDYVTINISSPNTPGLRELESSHYLNSLLKHLKATQMGLEDQYQRRVPLLLKISPDLATAEIKDIAALVLEHRVEGVVATNTSMSRLGMGENQWAAQAGGMSGKPLFPMASRVVAQLHNFLGDEVPIIGIGGIASGKDARTLLDAGACLVALYTGLIYEGPRLVRSIVEFLKKEG